MVFTKTRIHYDMIANVGGVQIKTKNSIKYLGLQLNPKWSFKDHVRQVAEKANKNNLGRILLNISISKPRRR